MCSTLNYQKNYPLPSTQPGQELQHPPMLLHLSKFRFDAKASFQKAPLIETSEKLMEQITRDGFVTTSEPVLVAHKEGGTPDRPLLPFSVGFMKGQARVLTLMAYVHYSIQNKIQLLPVVKETASQIYVTHVFLQDSRSELFYAMKIGCRGSIRKAPNSLGWCCSLLKLSEAGEADPSAVLRAWNSVAAKSDKIVGMKAQAIKNVLELPKQVRERILTTLSRMGWDACPFSDINLSSKKIMLGASFKTCRTASGSPWAQRGTVTKQSLELMVDNLETHKTRAVLGTKPTKADVESRLEMCTLAWWLTAEVARKMPALEKVMDEQFLQKVRDADPVTEVFRGKPRVWTWLV